MLLPMDDEWNGFSIKELFVIQQAASRLFFRYLRLKDIGGKVYAWTTAFISLSLSLSLARQL